MRRVLWVAFAITALGCQADKMIPVQGKVTLDGELIENGAIQFQPLDGTGPTAGAVITKGAYSTTVPPGKMRVEVRASKSIGKRKEFDTPDSRMVDMLAEAVPSKYNSESTLTADIASKMGSLDFDLKTTPK